MVEEEGAERIDCLLLDGKIGGTDGGLTTVTGMYSLRMTLFED